VAGGFVGRTLSGEQGRQRHAAEAAADAVQKLPARRRTHGGYLEGERERPGENIWA
jgi:hypothetical protein